MANINFESWMQIIIPGVFTLLGAYMSYKATLKAVKDNNKEQQHILSLQKEEEKTRKNEELRNIARLIYNDLTIAIYRSVVPQEYIKNLPMNIEYAKAITIVQGKLDPNNINYIYTLYGIIEKIRYSILTNSTLNTDILNSIRNDYIILQKEVFTSEKLKTIYDYNENMRTDDYVLGEVNKKTKDVLQCLKNLME